MARKRIALLLVLALFGGVLAACGPAAPGGSSAPPSGTVSEAPSSASDGPALPEDGNFNAEGYPIVDEKITLRFASNKGGLEIGYDDPTYIWQEIEPVTNIHIEWDNIPQAAWAERVNLMLATDDLPDAFLGGTGGALSASQQVTYGAQGALLDLTDLVAQYCPNVQAMHANNVDTKIVCTSPDGKMYSLPFGQELVHNQVYNRHYINKRWLDQLGLPIPETTEEFVEVLRAFKSNDLNGNEQNDEIPLSLMFGNHNFGFYGFLAAFGSLDDNTHVSVRDGVVLYEPITDAYREGVKWLGTLSEEGLLDPETFTQDVTQYDAKGQTDTMIYGCFSSWQALPYGPWTVGVEGDVDYIILPPLKNGENGQQMWQSRPPTIWGGIFCVTKANEYVPETMRWIDLCYAPDWSFELQYGPVGYMLEKDADGMYSFIEPENPADTPIRGRYAPGLPPSYISAQFFETRVKEAALFMYDAAQADVYVPFIDENYLPAVSYTPEETEEMAALIAEINPTRDTAVAKWMSGEGDIDAEWAEYVNTMNRLGVPRLAEIYQAAYDRYQALAG